MNNSFVIRQGRRFAQRVVRETGRDAGRQTNRMFQLALNRPPTPRERQLVTTLIHDHSLEHACWALLNSSEFLYLP
jgi:hypothetical protein